MGIFKRRDAGGPPPARRVGSSNMLPPDNVYSQALRAADDEYRRLGWPVRIGGCRMLAPGELEIAFVTTGDVPEGGLREALDRLPGPAEVQAVAERCVAFAGHEVIPVYFSEVMWRAAAPEWAYVE
jgi:hypothetical protein